MFLHWILIRQTTTISASIWSCLVRYSADLLVEYRANGINAKPSCDGAWSPGWCGKCAVDSRKSWVLCWTVGGGETAATKCRRWRSSSRRREQSTVADYSQSRPASPATSAISEQTNESLLHSTLVQRTVSYTLHTHATSFQCRINAATTTTIRRPFDCLLKIIMTKTLNRTHTE